MDKIRYKEFAGKILSWNNQNRIKKIVVWFASLYVFFMLAVMSCIGKWKLTYIITLLFTFMLGTAFVIIYIDDYIKVVGKKGKEIQNILRLDLPSTYFIRGYCKEIEHRIWEKMYFVIAYFGVGVFFAQIINWSCAFENVICLTIAVIILLLFVCKFLLYFIIKSSKKNIYDN